MTSRLVLLVAFLSACANAAPSPDSSDSGCVYYDPYPCSKDQCNSPYLNVLGLNCWPYTVQKKDTVDSIMSTYTTVNTKDRHMMYMIFAGLNPQVERYGHAQLEKTGAARDIYAFLKTLYPGWKICLPIGMLNATNMPP